MTIANDRYVPFVKSLLEMAGDHGWRGARIAVLVDAKTRPEELPTGCESLHWDSLLSREDRASLRDRYTTQELCCSLKPVVMSHLLNSGFERVHYFDSDIGVFGDLGGLDASLRECSIQLTPHCFEDPPGDGRSPDALTLLRAGVFNAGYLGVRSTTVGLSFLRWWAEKARDFGYMDPFAGMHADQRWLDLVPARFPEVEILRDRGLNVGHWNLHERPLTFDGKHYRASKERLIFFHFSGFCPESPHILSTHQDRCSVASDDTLSGLVDQYAQLVIANGYIADSSARKPQVGWNGLARLWKKLAQRTTPG